MRLDRDELSWAGPLWREALESPHLAYICALRSSDFGLMASSSFTKAGLFRSRRLVRLRAALAPVATAGAAFHSLSRRRQTHNSNLACLISPALISLTPPPPPPTITVLLLT
ncbi:Uncharacterized protein DAT39_011099 [Clarias magur]|uniref:Uncharacterized protein n=1 Tax=Clarias magur TaxID=1594786 RepID=A0A8J4X2W3_CLAMG|nr:Uncharacterized protein DAT39_011099 [Clarias magur]